MARVIVYAENDRVLYTFNGAEYRAVIVECHPVAGIAFSGGFEYTIRITSNKGSAYRSGDTFRTTAQFLTRKASGTRKSTTAGQRKATERKRAERKRAEQLKALHKEIMR